MLDSLFALQQKLAAQSSSLDDAHDKQSKAPKREPSAKADDTTFKKGVEASKVSIQLGEFKIGRVGDAIKGS